jgi:hypothetical protein
MGKIQEPWRNYKPNASVQVLKATNAQDVVFRAVATWMPKVPRTKLSPLPSIRP